MLFSVVNLVACASPASFSSALPGKGEEKHSDTQDSAYSPLTLVVEISFCRAFLLRLRIDLGSSLQPARSRIFNFFWLAAASQPRPDCI